MKFKTSPTVLCNENEILYIYFIKKWLINLNHLVISDKYFLLYHNHITYTKFLLMKMTKNVYYYKLEVRK